MKFARWCAVPLALVLTATVPAMGQDKKLDNKLPDAVAKALEKAETVDVYSLTGERAEKDDKDWRGWKSLGQTTLKKADEKKALAGAVTKGVTEGERGARCFIPRHGISATFEGKTYELVVCFECNWVYVYTDKGDKPQVFMTSESPQKAINKILTDAGVKLAKPEKPAK